MDEGLHMQLYKVSFSHKQAFKSSKLYVLNNSNDKMKILTHSFIHFQITNLLIQFASIILSIGIDSVMKSIKIKDFFL